MPKVFYNIVNDGCKEGFIAPLAVFSNEELGEVALKVIRKVVRDDIEPLRDKLLRRCSCEISELDIKLLRVEISEVPIVRESDTDI